MLRLAQGVLGLTLGVAPVSGDTAQSTFEFKIPQPARYRADSSGIRALMAAETDWVKAWPEDGSTNYVEFGSRVVVQLQPGVELGGLVTGSGLALVRPVTENVFILQAANAAQAMREAQRLASAAGVVASYPVLRRELGLQGAYAQRGDDPFFCPYFQTSLGTRIEAQWYIENKDLDGARLGLDLNAMAAWPIANGQGVTVAVADTGLDLHHSELTNALSGGPHFNFSTQTTNATPAGGGQTDIYRAIWTHGTSVAGLIAAQGYNGRGMVGVAPGVNLASWVMVNSNRTTVSDEALMDLYQYASNVVGVQNHSWGSGSNTKAQRGPTPLERIGMGNALRAGRNGLGTVFVRAAGNDRQLLADAEEDGYTNDPDTIAVGAVLMNGRATEYSEPGACLLVAAPGGEGDGLNGKPGLLTLDLVGSQRGVNSGITYGGDLSDYRWGVQGFTGTSASAPLVSGVVALILSANPQLSYRDVQQVLLLSARHWDLADPGLKTNGAGLLVSQNVGYGIPDAGSAVSLARQWPNRPALQVLTLTNTAALAIPDDGLRVEVSGENVPPTLVSIPSRPSFGPHADEPTPALPFIHVGLATNAISLNLTNKVALIERGGNTFEQKISYAAQAGAAAALIYNSAGQDDLALMLGTEYTSIPAVSIGHSDGEALRQLSQTNPAATARIRLQSVQSVFRVTSPMLCEHVGVRVQTDHPVRGDLRITLKSPMGTRSLLQHVNDDTNPGPTDWTYWSTHHFLESSVGEWTVSFSDELEGNTGAVRSVSLILRGTPIVDADRDGLEDGWEMAHFESLAPVPHEDPERDGYSNAREQLMGSNPLTADWPFQLDLTPWQLWGSEMMRLSWPGVPGHHYEVWAGDNPASLSWVTNVSGVSPETEWLAPRAGWSRQFYRLRQVQNP
jgi:subtilisin family serine protease/subtilisin-like proprotein convertase family protein